MASNVDIKQLLEAGAHFGHQTSRWHPKMGPFIHSKREGIHIIDLVQTVEGLEKALQFIAETAAAGKQVLLVSTKRQAKDKIKEVALATNMPYVSERWLGGMLTNVNTITGRIKHLKDLESRMLSGELEAKYSKLEVQRFQEEIDEMNRIYGGVKELSAKPGAVFVADVPNDINAVREANKLGIPVVALVDTNVDPTLIDYPIPCNDDAVKALNLVIGYVQTAIEDGKNKVKSPAKADDKVTGDSEQVTAEQATVKPAEKKEKSEDKPTVKTEQVAEKATEKKKKPVTSKLDAVTSNEGDK